MISAAHVWDSLQSYNCNTDILNVVFEFEDSKLPKWTLFFTPTRNQTVLCRGPPCDPSTMTPACCCRGPAGCGRSGRAEREAAAPGVRWNTGPFPAPNAPPWAAAPSGPWGTPAELERRGHNLPPSNSCRSCWKIWKLYVIQKLQNMAQDYSRVQPSEGGRMLKCVVGRWSTGQVSSGRKSVQISPLVSWAASWGLQWGVIKMKTP